MTDLAEADAWVKPAPVVITRRFPAPRALVFRAWSTAEHVKRWFSPAGLTTPEATVDFRPGGVFEVCMRWPNGTDVWSRGRFLEINAPERLVFEASVGEDSAPGFTAHTTVVFEEDGEGTRLTVTQSYDIKNPAFAAAVSGAPEGWRTTLDKLEAEVSRLKAEGAGVVHDSFTLERSYPVAASKVFAAFATPAAKARWFVGGDGYEVLEREMDVRPGGRERLHGRWRSGTETEFDAVYFDVEQDRRLVYAYEMALNGQRISVSLATIEFVDDGAGTRVRVTEQGAFLQGHLDGGSRERGTAMLLDRVGAYLRDLG